MGVMTHVPNIQYWLSIRFEQIVRSSRERPDFATTIERRLENYRWDGEKLYPNNILRFACDTKDMLPFMVNSFKTREFYEPLKELIAGKEVEFDARICLDFYNTSTRHPFNEPQDPKTKDYSYLIEKYVDDLFDTEFFKPMIFGKNIEIVDCDPIIYAPDESEENSLMFKTKFRGKLPAFPPYSEKMFIKRFSKPVSFHCDLKGDDDYLPKVLSHIDICELKVFNYQMTAMYSAIDEDRENVTTIALWLSKSGCEKTPFFGALYHYVMSSDHTSIDSMMTGWIDKIGSTVRIANMDKLLAGLQVYKDVAADITRACEYMDELLKDYADFKRENPKYANTLRGFVADCFAAKFKANPIEFHKRLKDSIFTKDNDNLIIIEQLAAKRLSRITEEDMEE